MAWIETIKEEDANDELKAAYDRVKTSRGRVSNIFRAQSLDPRSLEAHLDLYLSLMFGRWRLTRQQREMIAVVVSAANHCEYCVVHHTNALRKYVKDEEFIAKLVSSPRTASLDSKEMAMVDHALTLTVAPSSLDESHISALREKGMGDEEILQLTLIVSYFNFVNRLASGLGVRLEEEGQAAYKY